MDAQQIWELYQQGIEFKNSINLYETVSKNERFFAGDQWAGVYAPDLPKPVINFIKRACQQKIAEVKANPTKVYFSALDYPEAPGNEVSDGDAELLNMLFEADWERLKMDSVNLDGLQDACISGNYILYSYWDPAVKTGRPLDGQICVEAVDNVNFYPSNPNEPDVQKQPGIIIARREPTENVKLETQRNGMDTQLGLISSDPDAYYQSGDMSHIELRGDGNGKCITLLYLYRDAQTGHIMAQKTAREAVIRPKWDTMLTRYPIAMMNWEKRKNCCFGRAEITGLIPVQRYINQMYAMAMLCTMQSACPKPIFNQGMIKAWSTAIGSAIPVNGDVNAAAKYLEAPSLSQDAYNLPERLMRTALEMAGVPDVSLGNVELNNSSALIVARENADVPLETVKARFYSMMEDFARNWLDMMLAFCTVPMRHGVGDGRKTLFDASKLRDRLWSVRIDVGAATMWSEMAAVQTLTSLFNSGMLTLRQYLERLPDGYMPMRDKLLKETGENGPSGNNENGEINK